jgi:hypothetical protein
MSSGNAKSLEGLPQRANELREVPLLDDVTAAADRMRAAEAERRSAQEELRERIRAAHAEGVPFASIARAAGLSRERVRQLHAGR